MEEYVRKDRQKGREGEKSESLLIKLDIEWGGMCKEKADRRKERKICLKSCKMVCLLCED